MSNKFIFEYNQNLETQTEIQNDQNIAQSDIIQNLELELPEYKEEEHLVAVAKPPKIFSKSEPLPLGEEIDKIQIEPQKYISPQVRKFLNIKNSNLEKSTGFNYNYIGYGLLGTGILLYFL